MLLEGPQCRLNVEVIGAGEPVSVWAHGVTSSVAEVKPMAGATAGTRVLFDFRGHGLSDSPPPDAGYDHAAMRADLEFVANHFRATHAFGVSMGAGALMNWLADEPDRFRRLGFFIPGSIDEPNTGTAHFESFASALGSRPLAEVAEAAMHADENAPLFSARPRWRRLVRSRILRMNSTGVPRALRAYRDGTPPLPDGSVLKRVAAPALILAHDGDPLHSGDVARRLAALLPNATLHIWPSPLAMLDDPFAFARLIGDFMSAL